MGDFNARPTAAEMTPIFARFVDAWTAGVPTADNPNGYTYLSRERSVTAVPRALLIAVLFAGPAAAQPGGVPAPQRPPCEQASDDQFGYTRERPIQVGGSPMYGAARQRRYLEALRGPGGQSVTYKRLGQAKASAGHSNW